MSGHIVRVVTPSTHDAEQEVVDDYLVNARDSEIALRIVLAGVDIPVGAETLVLSTKPPGASFNNTGVSKGGFLKLPSRSVTKGRGLQP